MMYCSPPDSSLAEILLFPDAGLVSHAIFFLISISLLSKKTTVTKHNPRKKTSTRFYYRLPVLAPFISSDPYRPG
jgi:hypothetical protein